MPWSPPEVLTGQSNGAVTSDVYSLAATVWQLLVGRSPFAQSGDNSERAIFTRILHSKPPSTGRADVPGSLDRVLQQAMAKKPEHRPQSAMEFARHLQRIEQEMRYARTEIVVLEQAPHPTQSASTAPVESDDDLTILNRPATVVPAQSAVKSPPAEPAAGPAAPADDDATEMRPQIVAATPASPPAETDTEADTGDLTEMRPARPTRPTVPPAAPAEADPRPRSPLVVIAAVLAVVAAIAVIGLILANQGDDTPPPAMPTSTGPSSLDDLTGGGSTPDPVLRARTDGDSVTFRITEPVRGARYEWSSQVPGGAMEPRPAASNQRTLTVRSAQPGDVCAEVLVFAGGGSGKTFSLCQEVG